MVKPVILGFYKRLLQEEMKHLKTLLLLVALKAPKVT